MKVGIIGFGKMGKIHYRICCQLVEEGVIDDVYTYDTIVDSPNSMSLQEMKTLDAVIIATPSEKHQCYVKEFHSMSIPVFCEKPLATNRSSINPYVLLFVGYVERYNPVVTKLSEILSDVREDKEDKILYVNTVRASALSNVHLDGVLKGREIISDLGIHDYDLLNQLFRGHTFDKPTFKQGIVIEDSQKRAIFARTFFKLAGGTPCDTTVSWIDPVKKREYTVYTKKKIIFCDLVKQKIEVRDQIKDNTDIYEFSVEPIKEELKVFFKLVQKRGTLITSDKHGIDAEELALEIAEKSEVIHG